MSIKLIQRDFQKVRNLPHFCTHLIETLLEVSKWSEKRNMIFMMNHSKQRR